MKKCFIFTALIVLFAISLKPALSADGLSSNNNSVDATSIVKAAVDHWRGVSSYTEMSMTIHRPDWERTMSMRAWTKGEKESLVRITEPRKDQGNGTLTIDNNMWSFSPKVNRVIKVPSSMMNQSWMGSDFSNKDISRSDDIIDQYVHTLINTTEQDGHAVYTIESIPHEDSAVVWGKEIMLIRDDNILVSHEFYDQDGEQVKVLASLEIGELGGRSVAISQRMNKTNTPDEWTEIKVDDVEYDIELRANVFTQSNLRNPRD